MKPLILLLLIGMCFVAGCHINQIKQISYDEEGNVDGYVEYFSYGFVADMTKVKARGKADANGIEVEFGKSVTDYKPENVKNVAVPVGAALGGL